MIVRCVKILLAVVLSLTFTISLAKLVLCVWSEWFIENSADYEILYGYQPGGRGGSSSSGGGRGGSLVDDWLDQNQLGKYRQLFRDGVTDKDQPRDFYDEICMQNSKISKFTKFCVIYCGVGGFLFWCPSLIPNYIRYFSAKGNISEPVRFELPMEQEFYGLQIRTNIAHYNIFMGLSLLAYYVCSYFWVIKVSPFLSMIKYGSLAHRLVAGRVSKLTEINRSTSKGIQVSELVEIVKLHELAFELTNLLEEIVNIAIALQLFACVLFWCLTMFYASRNINLNLFSMVLLFFLSLLETYGYSYLGSELTLEAENVGKAIYNLPWYEHSAEMQKYYCFIIQRTQKKIGVTNAKFFLVGLDTFGRVVNMSISYYLVLKDVLTKL